MGNIIINKDVVINLVKNNWDSVEVRNMLFQAYNRYQEDERFGVDYIFDIKNTDDLICCVKGGLTATDIANIKNSGHRFFYFGCNYLKPVAISAVDIKAQIFGYIDEIIEQTLLYPWENPYREIYTMFITNKLLK